MFFSSDFEFVVVVLISTLATDLILYPVSLFFHDAPYATVSLLHLSKEVMCTGCHLFCNQLTYRGSTTISFSLLFEKASVTRCFKEVNRWSKNRLVTCVRASDIHCN